jgi:hypothetical protein
LSRQERYLCHVLRDREGQVRAVRLDATDTSGDKRHVEVNSTIAARVAGPIHDVLRASGVSGRAWSSSAPLDLLQHPGSHIELLLRAVKPMRRGDRVDAVAEGVARMSREEASYWHARSHRRGGLRAIRVLLIADRS